MRHNGNGLYREEHLKQRQIACHGVILFLCPRYPAQLTIQSPSYQRRLAVMPLFELLAILTLVVLAWFWIDSLAARDIAIAAARQACQADGKQFLDESISVKNLRALRNDEGHLCIGRTYEFEYSETSDDRRRGSVVMLGRQVIIVNTGLVRVH